MSTHPHSETTRIEAFSDGVFAIIITIMVLELHPPEHADLPALLELWPVFSSYLLSFIYVAIYWNNHHHLLHATHGITGRIMWANMFLLFWLSLIPFSTNWLGESHLEALPGAIYGFVLLMAAVSYWVLVKAILHHQGRDSELADALRGDWKGKLSIVFYAIAIPIAYLNTWVSSVLFALVALMWFIPDRRLATMFDHSMDGKRKKV